MAANVFVYKAARNNAEWCDSFCRTHGISGRFNADVWTSSERTPPLYPDAVTLVEGCSLDPLLARVDRSAGCSIKDSFGVLDLSQEGFEVLFTAEWLWQEPPVRAVAPSGWSAVVDARELAKWEVAWGAAPKAAAFFRDELLADARVSVLARYDGDAIVGGAIANRSRTVIGLSNVFDAEGDTESVWSGAATAARTRFAPIPVVGYETGESLAAARIAGFKPIGDLAVWIKPAHP
jgi:hypothetical protein